MTKKTLEKQLAKIKAETKEALEILWENVNHGQKKQILKIPEVKELFERYEIEP